MALSPGGLRLAGLLFLLTVFAVAPALDGMAIKWAGPALGCLLAAWGLRKGVKLDWIDGLACLGLAWAGASLTWSHDPALGSVQWLKACALVLCFLGLRRLRMVDVLPQWAGVASLVVVVLAWCGLPILGNPNFEAEFLLIALPLLAHRRWTWPIAVLSGVYLFGWCDSKLPWVAAAGWGAWAVLEVARDRGWFAYVVALVVGGVSAALLFMTFRFDPSFQWSLFYRLELWAGTAGMWLLSPLVGNGLGSFNFLYPGFLDAEMALLGPKDYSVIANAGQIAGAAHNDFLQLAAELGLVGLAIAGAWLFLALKKPATKFQERCWAGAGLAVLLAYVGFPMQNAPSALLALACFAGLNPAPLGKSRAVPFVALIVGGLASVAVAAQTVAQAHLSVVGAAPQVAFAEGWAAYRAFPADFMARLMLFQAMARAEADGLAVVDEATALSLYEIGLSASPQHPGLLMARAAWLARDGRCEPECAAIIEHLLKHASRVSEVVKLRNALEKQNADPF